MDFEDMLDFSTVYLNRHNIYQEIGSNEILKGQKLLEILNETKTKSLIYAASYAQIEKVSNLLNENLLILNKGLLVDFSNWLILNYDVNWKLTNLIKRGIGIHNGQLHRSLSQIQVKLFEEKEGLDSIISTSSIIEGVNTSAENVIVWRNRRSGGNAKLDVFTYKNIIGRGGRMFKYFVGQIYLLESPPDEKDVQLEISFPDEILGDIDETLYKESLTDEQIAKIIDFKQEMYAIIGKKSYDNLLKENVLQNSNSEFIKTIAKDMKESPDDWNGLSYLNSDNPDFWERLLYKIIHLTPGEWGDGPYGVQHKKFVQFVKVLSRNWTNTIPELLDDLDSDEIDIEQFFKLERTASFKLAALISDINILQKEIINNGVDVSPFVSKVSHAFLPSVVYQLEEYGLPRMISKKLHEYKVINFFQEDLTIHAVIDKFNGIKKENIFKLPFLDNFDKYILDYFYDGISTNL